MKNLFLLFAIIGLVSCGETKTETEVILQDTTAVEETQIEETTTFDTTGITTVGELLDTLSAMPSEGGEVVVEETE